MAGWIGLIFVLLLGLALLVVVVVWGMSRLILRPPRMTDAKAVWLLKRLSPGDLGLAYSNVIYEVRDANARLLKIAGWWIGHPASSGKCVVLIHGYADAKVGSIAWAPLFHSLGWNVLAIDLRSHGESDGNVFTAGLREREDLSQVLDQLQYSHREQTRTLVLFGASVGAAVALAVAEQRTDIAAVIADSPIYSFRSAASRHMELMGLPRGKIVKWALELAEKNAGGSFEEVAPYRLLATVKSPVLLIQCEVDVLTVSEEQKEMESALVVANVTESLSWNVLEAGHLMSMVAEPEEYRRRVGAFLEVVLERVHRRGAEIAEKKG